MAGHANGYHGGPASFSRLMDMIMEGAESIITYIDYVLIHSHSPEDHFRYLAEALSRLRKAHLCLNPGKCVFAAAEVQYLGHTISSKGIKPGKDK